MPYCAPRGDTAFQTHPWQYSTVLPSRLRGPFSGKFCNTCEEFQEEEFHALGGSDTVSDVVSDVMGSRCAPTAPRTVRHLALQWADFDAAAVAWTVPLFCTLTPPAMRGSRKGVMSLWFMGSHHRTLSSLLKCMIKRVRRSMAISTPCRCCRLRVRQRTVPIVTCESHTHAWILNGVNMHISDSAA